MKYILITGGMGFIGKHTANYILNNTDYGVILFDNLSSSIKDDKFISNDRVEFILGDIRNLQDISKLKKYNTEYIIHLAAIVSVYESMINPILTKSANIDGFLNILTFAKDNNIKKMLYASSAATYGENQNLPLKEDYCLKPISNYGLEKASNEMYAYIYSKEYNMDLVGVRYFNVFGEGQLSTSPYAGVISIFLEKISKNEGVFIFGDGTQTRDFIYVKDVAKANFEILKNKVITNTVLNIGTGKSTSLLDIVEIISGCYYKKTEISFEKEREGDIKHSLSDNSLMLSHGLLCSYTVKSGLEDTIGKVK